MEQTGGEYNFAIPVNFSEATILTKQSFISLKLRMLENRYLPTFLYLVSLLIQLFYYPQRLVLGQTRLIEDFCFFNFGENIKFILVFHITCIIYYRPPLNSNVDFTG